MFFFSKCNIRLTVTVNYLLLQTELRMEPECAASSFKSASDLTVKAQTLCEQNESTELGSKQTLGKPLQSTCTSSTCQQGATLCFNMSDKHCMKTELTYHQMLYKCIAL